MADNTITDMLGGGYLKELTNRITGTGSPGKTDSNYKPLSQQESVDAAKRNQDYADKQLKKSASPSTGKSPLSTTMTPVSKGKGK